MKRISIYALLLIAAVSGIAIFFSQCNTTPVKQDDTQLKQAEKQVAVIDNQYQQKNLLLQKQNDSLQQVIAQSEEKLKTAKVKLNQSRQTVVYLIQKDTTGKTTTEMLVDYDSLKVQTTAYVAFVDSTLAACEETISGLKSQVALKDIQLSNCDSSYTQLKKITDEGLKRERQLTDDLNKIYKQQHKKKVKNRLVAGALLVLSSISAALFIK